MKKLIFTISVWTLGHLITFGQDLSFGSYVSLDLTNPCIISGQYEIKNISDFEVDQTFEIKIFIYDENTQFEQEIGSVTASGIQGNQTLYGEFNNKNITLVPGFTAGVSYAVIAYVDPLDEIAEENEENNILQMGYTVCNEGGPNSALVIQGLNSFQVYPNPAKSSINILGNKLREYHIVNVLGITVMSGVVSNGSNTTIDISTINSGHYFIYAVDEQGNLLTKRFLKN